MFLKYLHEFQIIFVNFRFTNIFIKIYTDILSIYQPGSDRPVEPVQFSICPVRPFKSGLEIEIKTSHFYTNHMNLIMLHKSREPNNESRLFMGPKIL